MEGSLAFTAIVYTFATACNCGNNGSRLNKKDGSERPPFLDEGMYESSVILALELMDISASLVCEPAISQDAKLRSARAHLPHLCGSPPLQCP
jgi:hypothetical protein